jgi:hypothetical protein
MRPPAGRSSTTTPDRSALRAGPWEQAKSSPLRNLSGSAQADLRAPLDAPRMNDKHSRLLRRREALALAGLGVTGALGARVSGALGTQDAEAASCVLSPEVTDGPYWIDNKLTRRDIAEDRPGLPLELVLTVQNAKTCSPIKGADVEIWHCDAGGVYSGYESGSAGAPGGQHATPTDSERYLRGHQKADSHGRARFLQVPRPARYEPRRGHDLRPGRALTRDAEAGQAQQRPQGPPRLDHARRRDLAAGQPALLAPARLGIRPRVASR